jgi:hypothetical protein
MLTFLVSSGLVFGQSDVTAPGDAVTASSDNSPGSEGVANAIDNQPTKYLNFDKVNTGLTVTPSVGATLVTGLNLTSANDAPERDPATYLLEGSNDGTNFIVISEGDVPAFADRFTTVNVSFDNGFGYKTYRLTFPTVSNVDGANSMQISEIEFLGTALSPDVIQPGDPLVASSDNSPGSEGGANAVDNQPTKYLNFDKVDTGFTVTPSVGATIVTGISLQSANDAPERDPASFTVEGSNDDGVTFELIASGDVPAFPARFSTVIIPFENTQPYKTYRVIFPTVANVDGANSMQIAEVELLGTVAPQDVTQPGDALVASSDNSPGSEGGANAIDNQPTKYLNFDKVNTGFTVTPAVGETLVTGISLTSANDAPERDPASYTIEGSNDGGATFELVASGDVAPFGARFETQTFFFENSATYTTYRVIFPTVANVDGANSMQISEVELLGFAAGDNLPKFKVQPVDTPVLVGSAATFFVEVDGPWSIQWYKNGEKIAGATQLSYTSDTVTADNAGDIYYATAANGQLVSQSEDAAIVIFEPAEQTSIAVSFEGSGANGAPTAVATDDIAGAWQQAYWNSYPDATGFYPGTDIDGNPVPVLDSNGNESSITFDFQTTGTWGSGTGTVNADRRMLNGLVQGGGTITFGNVPAGEHAILVYSVARPLEFPNINISIDDFGTPLQEVFMRQLNADEYNPAPGFFRVTGGSATARGVGNFVRFDGVSPNSSGSITVAFAGAGGGSATINGIQLVLNAPDPGNPPQILQQPQSASILAGNPASMSVNATGTEPLSYQWRLNGANLVNGAGVSGVNEATLNIDRVSADDAGIYTVAVSNAAGTSISSPAVLDITNGSITDRLSEHFTFDAAASAIGAGTASFNGFAPADYVTGQIGGAVRFNGSSYIVIDGYERPSKSVTVSMWIKPEFGSFANVPRLVGNFVEGAPYQFQFGYEWPGAADNPNLVGRLQVGPNQPNVQGPQLTDWSFNDWTHLVFTADGAQMRVYQDGQLIGSGDYLGNISAGGTTPLVVGAFLAADLTPNPTTGLPDFYTGLMDDLAIWNRSLSAGEISAVYTYGLDGQDLTKVPDQEGQQEPDQPALNVSFVNGEVVFTWADPAGAGFKLQSRSSLDGTWSDVTDGTGTSATISADGDADGDGEFFRLIWEN